MEYLFTILFVLSICEHCDMIFPLDRNNSGGFSLFFASRLLLGRFTVRRGMLLCWESEVFLSLTHYRISRRRYRRKKGPYPQFTAAGATFIADNCL